ncbi:TonB-dependent receptor domain-containing protein [uncultured Sphingomonas sp.]|uniref:TonB-dependent receptor domain-containing protein n=1 Tax=uncultured Sphingomonas sp. TaxID=158754 RepID=UPI0035CADC23
MADKRFLAACAISALAWTMAMPAAAQVAGSATPQGGPAGIQAAGAQPVEAQSADAPATQDIVVTGSLIRGTPEDAAIPVDVIGAAEIAKQGNPSPVELLKALPTSSGVTGDSNQFDSRAQGGGGVASVNLRGLGPSRTLVLLNSKRLANTNVAGGATDINLLPLAAIGRIEVLKDGGAATYGSDAVAGVVNFITRTDQEGFNVGGSYKWVKNTDGDIDASISYGHHGNGFRVLAAIGFQKRGELLARDRQFTNLTYPQNPEGGWTGGGNPATFIALGATGAPINVAGPTGLIGSLQADSSCTSLGGFVGNPKPGYPGGQCYTKYSPYDALVELEKRGQAYLDFEADLPGNSKLEITALYGRTTDPHGLTSPSYLLTQAPSRASGAISSAGFFVPANNPGFIAYRASNPAQFPAASVGVLFPTLLFRPYLTGGNPLFLDDSKESGSSRAEGKNERFRATVDVSGDITSSINYDLGVTYDDYNKYFDGYDSFGDRVQRALLGLGGYNCTGTTPGANGCEFLNPFGNAVAVNAATGNTNPQANGPANTASLASWIFQRGSTVYDTELFVADAQISGKTGVTLPGGDVAFALGGQYRKTWFETKYSGNGNIAQNPCRDTPITGQLNPAACSPLAGSTTPSAPNGANAFLGTSAPVSVNQDVYAAFGELQVPIFDTVNLQASARFEDYRGGIGSTFNPQARLRWQVTPWLALRGGIGTTFRGPTPQNTSPTKITTLQLIGSTFTPTDTLGNAALKPEKSTNYSGGIILKFGGFQATVDYFKYKLTDAIVTDPLASMVATLFPTGLPNTCAANPGLAARFTFNTNGPCVATTVVSQVSRVLLQLQNGPDQQNDGLDFQVDYNHRDLFGTNLRFGAGVVATYSIEDKIGVVNVAGTQVSAAFDGVGKLNYQTILYPLPKWKGQAHVDLGDGPIDARVTVNYSDGLHDQRYDTRSGPFAPNANLGGVTLTQGADINEFVTADFNLSVDVGHHVTVTGTVFNILDAQPPFAREDYDYEPFVGNPYGRMFKLALNTRF